MRRGRGRGRGRGRARKMKYILVVLLLTGCATISNQEYDEQRNFCIERDMLPTTKTNLWNGKPMYVICTPKDDLVCRPKTRRERIGR